MLRYETCSPRQRFAKMSLDEKAAWSLMCRAQFPCVLEGELLCLVMVCWVSCELCVLCQSAANVPTIGQQHGIFSCMSQRFDFVLYSPVDWYLTEDLACVAPRSNQAACDSVWNVNCVCKRLDEC